ncbi:hypothetical protein DQ04_11811000 [Trypanosoma grayi]|uniref:hypothetical protein n=1 Tax=Trypanosoma grayi TaxID=71804 RepID=UPI0004F408AD|nr:hypothetical protein DQ04_11811000 [Trypanosoma grayi]KEG06878.1 hypothetical protein DQ04_11811000 [Trypanosoma grayi]
MKRTDGAKQANAGTGTKASSPSDRAPAGTGPKRGTDTRGTTNTSTTAETRSKTITVKTGKSAAALNSGGGAGRAPVPRLTSCVFGKSIPSFIRGSTQADVLGCSDDPLSHDESLQPMSPVPAGMSYYFTFGQESDSSGSNKSDSSSEGSNEDDSSGSSRSDSGDTSDVTDDGEVKVRGAWAGFGVESRDNALQQPSLRSHQVPPLHPYGCSYANRGPRHPSVKAPQVRVVTRHRGTTQEEQNPAIGSLSTKGNGGGGRSSGSSQDPGTGTGVVKRNTEHRNANGRDAPKRSVTGNTTNGSQQSGPSSQPQTEPTLLWSFRDINDASDDSNEFGHDGKRALKEGNARADAALAKEEGKNNSKGDNSWYLHATENIEWVDSPKWSDIDESTLEARDVDAQHAPQTQPCGMDGEAGMEWGMCVPGFGNLWKRHPASVASYTAPDCMLPPIFQALSGERDDRNYGGARRTMKGRLKELPNPQYNRGPGMFSYNW